MNSLKRKQINSVKWALQMLESCYNDSIKAFDNDILLKISAHNIKQYKNLQSIMMEECRIRL